MEEILTDLGLSSTEAKAYLTLSEIGIATAYKVSKKAKLYKSNTYDALHNLEQKGLVTKLTVDNRELYEAADPTVLLELIDEKKNRLAKIVPTIKLIQKSSATESHVRISKGNDVLKDIFYSFLEYKEPILTYGVPKVAFQFVRPWISGFHKERIRMGIRMYHIYNFEAHERVKKLYEMKHTPTRCLPKLYDSNVATLICGDDLVFVLFHPYLKMIEIHDKDMAEAYRKYFWILWKNAERIKV